MKADYVTLFEWASGRPDAVATFDTEEDAILYSEDWIGIARIYMVDEGKLVLLMTFKPSNFKGYDLLPTEA